MYLRVWKHVTCVTPIRIAGDSKKEGDRTKGIHDISQQSTRSHQILRLVNVFNGHNRLPKAMKLPIIQTYLFQS